MTATLTASQRIARMKHLFNIKRETQDRIQNLNNNLGSLNRLVEEAITMQDKGFRDAVAENYRLTYDSLNREHIFLATVDAEIKTLHALREEER